MFALVLGLLAGWALQCVRPGGGQVKFNHPQENHLVVRIDKHVVVPIFTLDANGDEVVSELSLSQLKGT